MHKKLLEFIGIKLENTKCDRFIVEGFEKVCLSQYAHATFGLIWYLRSHVWCSLHSLDRTIAFALPTSVGRKNGKNVKRSVCVCVCMCLTPHASSSSGAKLAKLKICPLKAGNQPRKSQKLEIGRGQTDRQKSIHSYILYFDCWGDVCHVESLQLPKKSAIAKKVCNCRLCGSCFRSTEYTYVFCSFQGWSKQRAIET